ncbi:wax ester/triacylglycerol synthase domain-containing protein [Mycobacterium camsae]|uniref:wax ester/triacylglycerol synthase domain-containing protein n=1 Tax=Mycobacterium gordonae TaxID=1778 RepID=UPI0019824D69|nr:wax ester/triacylglycerol synthase domain-containing protein [Mycobacterium gordonae]
MAEVITPGIGPARARGSDPRTGMVTGAVAVVAGPAPGSGEIKELLAERFGRTSTPDVDITAHVQRVALPTPGDDDELFRAIAHALERPLDPGRPRWECWIIEGLRDDQWAILIKIGREVAEHLSPAHLLARLCTPADHTGFIDSVATDPVSPTSRSGWTDVLWQAAAFAVNGLTAAASALQPLLAGGPAPTARHYRTVVVPRGAVDHIARKFGVTADDVALAAITEGFRTVLLQRGQRPQADSLRILGSALTQLPVEHRDPLQQLRAVPNQARPQPGVRSPLALCSKVIDVFSRTPRQSVVALATTPPGPRHRLRLMGRRLERLLPIPPTAPESGTGVAFLSYGDDLVFGITTDYDTAPDVLAGGIESGLARLVAASGDSVVPFDRRRKRPTRALPNGAARWRPSSPPARVRH